MTLKSLLRTSIVAAGALGAAAASAVPITFDFSNGRAENSATFQSVVKQSQGGLNLDVTGYTDTLGFVTSSQVSQWSGGLGVKGGGSSNTQVDASLFSNELLKFDFSQEVEVQSISFMFFDSDDSAKVVDYDAKFFWDKYVETITKGETTTSNGLSTFTFSDNFFTSLLGVTTADLSDNFTIRSLTVNTKTAAAAVPEPSMIGLLGIGLIGLGLARRRSSSNV
jgi:hypothetical protein